MLHPTTRAKERILLFGSYGTGKTKAWCQIAAWLRRTKAPGTMYVLDSDNTTDRMASGYGEEFYENVVARDTFEWVDYRAGINEFSDVSDKDDWLVVDMIETPWQAAQRFFIQEVYGKDSADWYLDFRKEKSSGHPLAGDYGINWTVINEQYAAFMGKVTRWPGHVLCCTSASAISQPDRSGKGGDSREILEIFGRFGVKPSGQKNLGHQFHSVLLMGVKGGKDEEWWMTSVKDREREKVFNKVVEDFCMDYLIGVGGWEL